MCSRGQDSLIFPKRTKFENENCFPGIFCSEMRMVSQLHSPPYLSPSLQLHSSPSFLLPILRKLPPRLSPYPRLLLPTISIMPLSNIRSAMMEERLVGGGEL
jgi:hypothetical protein